MGITFITESDKLTTTSDPESDSTHRFDIKQIDFIYNPEYSLLTSQYKLPVFFKSTLNDPTRLPYLKQGFLDNGRHKVTLRDPDSPYVQE